MIYMKILIVILSIVWFYNMFSLYRKNNVYEKKRDYEKNENDVQVLIKINKLSMIIMLVIILIGLIIKFNK